MSKETLLVLVVASVFTFACARRVPERVGVAPGTPHISWIVMSGDRDNPDQEFVCQSEPRNECVMPASRPDARVFSDVHVYYHGAGAETKYTGPIDIGFFEGSPASRTIQANTTVRKTGSIMNHSVTGIVTSRPGRYAMTFAVVATVTDTGKSQPVESQVPVVVK